MKGVLRNTLRKVVFAILILMLIWTIFNPFDRYMWIANFLVATLYGIGFILVDRKVHFTDISVILFFVHMVIIILAAKYTYENFEPFNMLQSAFNLSRNYFDRVGHFFQGVTPVMLFREIYIKGNHMKKGTFLSFTLIMITLGASGAWEVVEFVFAGFNNKFDVLQKAMQGDFWDAQQDMLICTIGAFLALLTISNKQDVMMEEENE